MHYVYILKSINHDKYYIGITNDVERRIDEHNAGFSNFTSKFKPWTLVYHEAYTSEKLAITRERKLKNHGKGFQELKKRILDEKGEG